MPAGGLRKDLEMYEEALAVSTVWSRDCGGGSLLHTYSSHEVAMAVRLKKLEGGVSLLVRAQPRRLDVNV